MHWVMAQTILELKAHGVGILLSEQNLFFASMVADRVCVIEKGQVSYRAGMNSFMTDEAAKKAYLGM